MPPLLEIKNLSVSFGRGDSEVKAVRDLSLSVAAGETVGLVGESGSGKSVSALSILKLLPYPAASHPGEGRVMFDGQNLIDDDERDLEELHCARISELLIGALFVCPES